MIFKMNVYTCINTPIGNLYIAEEKDCIYYVGINPPLYSKKGNSTILKYAAEQISDYFAGEYKDAFTVPLQLTGTTFEQRIYSELINVGYGETISYGELAARAGCPGGARAAGNVLHKNPLLILVPCHRVIGSDGSLRNFALGVNVKKYLLDLEHT